MVCLLWCFNELQLYKAMYQTSKAARQDLNSVDSVVAAIKTIEDKYQWNMRVKLSSITACHVLNVWLAPSRMILYGFVQRKCIKKFLSIVTRYLTI